MGEGDVPAVLLLGGEGYLPEAFEVLRLFLYWVDLVGGHYVLDHELEFVLVGLDVHFAAVGGGR